MTLSSGTKEQEADSEMEDEIAAEFAESEE